MSCRIAATFVEGNEVYSGDEWVYPGRVSYTIEFMHDLALQHNLALTRIAWPHSDNQTWVVFRDPTLSSIPELGFDARVPFFESQLTNLQQRLIQLERHPVTRIARKLRLLSD